MSLNSINIAVEINGIIIYMNTITYIHNNTSVFRAYILKYNIKLFLTVYNRYVILFIFNSL